MDCKVDGHLAKVTCLSTLVTDKVDSLAYSKQGLEGIRVTIISDCLTSGRLMRSGSCVRGNLRTFVLYKSRTLLNCDGNGQIIILGTGSGKKGSHGAVC